MHALQILSVRLIPVDTAAAARQQGPWSRLQHSRALRLIASSAILRNLVLLVLWLLVWELARLVEYTTHASVWFPVAGLTFAVLLLDGTRALPGLACGCILITLWAGHTYDLPLSMTELALAGVLWAAAHIGAYALGTHCLRALARRGSRELPKLVVSFLVVAALASLLATVLGIWVLVATGMMAAADVRGTWLAYWIGDMAGVVVLAPFFAAVLGSLYPENAAQFTATYKLHHGQATPHYKYKLLVNLVLLTCAMLLAYTTQSRESAFVIFFLVIPYMWIACT